MGTKIDLKEGTEGTIRIRISVREFVEFLLRTGDIDNRGRNIRSAEAMLLGSRVHRQIQNSAGAGYEAEVPLKYVIYEDDYNFSIEGRADGIIHNDEGITVDEIKGMYTDVLSMEEPVNVHLGQAKVYAFICGVNEDVDSIGVRMTYVSLYDNKDKKYFNYTYSMEELKEWFMELVEEYKKWIEYKLNWRRIRNESMAKLIFPYEYREGQLDLIKDVYRTILREKVLFLQAPTGVGKTICTVFPTIKAMGEGLVDRVFYLTAKTITRTAAEDAFNLMRSKGMEAKILTITAKDKVCPLEERLCNPDDCPYAKDYYDKINDAVYEYINMHSEWNRESMVEFAMEKGVCPFEFTLDCAYFADGIICDYNYVFDPNVYLKRFFEAGVKQDQVFLIDEAHNMVERGRKMYSASMCKEDILAMKRFMAGYSKRVESALNQCNKILLSYKRECDEYKILDTASPFIMATLRLYGEIDRFYKEHPGFDGGDEWRDFYLNLRHFVNMCDIMDDSYYIYTEHKEDGNFYLNLACIDPGRMIEERLRLGRSAVYFSATLLPIHYYKKMLLDEIEPYAIYANTPFSEEQSLIMVARDVSSKYTRRNATEYRNIASYIEKIVNAKKGNYMVFFPSYRFMQDVLDSMEDGDYRVICQNSAMTEEEREEFLLAFHEERGTSLIGMCVMGGIFSEGIDLTEDRLIGVIVVGTGLPQVGHEREVLKTFFDNNHENGFDFSYRYPGMNKVMQAAGRVIRTKNDKGIILLLDERFHEDSSRKLFPREWSNYKSVTLDTVEKLAETFWNGKE